MQMAWAENDAAALQAHTTHGTQGRRQEWRRTILATDATACTMVSSSGVKLSAPMPVPGGVPEATPRESCSTATAVWELFKMGQAMTANPDLTPAVA